MVYAVFYTFFVSLTQNTWCFASVDTNLWKAARPLPQILSNFLQSDLENCWHVLFVAIPDIQHSCSTFSFWQPKNAQFHPCCHSDVLAQVTDTLQVSLEEFASFLDRAPKNLQKVLNISITANYDDVINVTSQCNNYWRSYISVQLQMYKTYI